MPSKGHCFQVVAAIAIVLTVISSHLNAAQIQLSWTAPTTNADNSPLTDLAGYRLHYGQTSGSYASSVDVGNQTTYPLSGLTGGQQYYFVVTAYDTSGNESLPSEEVSAIAPAATDTTPPTVGVVSVPDGSSDIDPNTSITISFSEAMDPTTITSSTVWLRDAAGNVVTASVTYDAATHTMTLDPTSALAPGTTYTVIIEGGTDGVKDMAGNPMEADITWSFTTSPPSTCPCSIWSAGATPAADSWSDASAVEVGVKFRADLDGFVTALRFYKGPANTGPHVGNLWTHTGTLLASVTFAGETASGWQQMDLPTAVAITANTTYVASYHTMAGHYAVTTAYFAGTGVDNPPLRALTDGMEGGNGVYKYGASGFPTQTFNANNYWVDVVFTATAPPPPPPPPSAGLVAAYSFEEGSGAIAADASSNGNHGTISGARWITSGRFGKALRFDGVNDWVSVADSASLDLTTGMTLEAWVYPTELSGGSANGWRTVILKEQPGHLVYALYANADTNRPSAYVYTSNHLGVFGNTQLPLKAWRHLATTYDGAVLNLYVNGALVGSRTLSGGLRTSGNALRIGGNSIWGEFFKGRIDEVRIYNRPLTADEIQHDMNTPVMTAAGAALVRHDPSMARLREALLGNVSPSRAPSSLVANAEGRQSRRPAGFSPRTPAASAESAAMPHLIEAGEVLVTQQWQRVDFDAAFVDPVVIANALSSQSTAAAVVIMRNVGPTGFEIRFQPWAEVEAALSSETVGFLALERGTYTLADGTLVEAGHVTVDPAKLSQDIAFSRPFNTLPVVMATVTSASEATPAVSQVQTVTKNGLRLRVHGMSGRPVTDDTKTLSYIAWEPSSGRLQGYTFAVNRRLHVEAAPVYPLMFSESFQHPPILLADIQGARYGRPLPLRWTNKDTHGVDVQIDGVRWSNERALRTMGVIGYIAIW